MVNPIGDTMLAPAISAPNPNVAPMPAPIPAAPFAPAPMAAPAMAQPAHFPTAEQAEFAPPMAPQPDLYIPESPPDEGWGKLGVAMVGMAMLFAGGVAYFIATSGGGSDNTSSSKASKVATSDESDPKSVETEAQPATIAMDAALVVEEQPSADAGAVVAIALPSSDAGTAVAVAETGAQVPAVEAPAVETPPTAENPTDTSKLEGAVGLLRANGEVDRPAGLVSLVIESNPVGANVVRKRDGVRLGVTPYQYDAESEPGTMVFIIEKPGYRSFIVSMPANRDGIRQVVLLPGSSQSAALKEPSEPASGQASPPKKKQASVQTPPKKRKPATTPAKQPKRAPKSGGKVDYNPGSIPMD